jgi:hypothetical protein
LVGMRISTWGSVNARKPRSCNSWLPAGKGYGVVYLIAADNSYGLQTG